MNEAAIRDELEKLHKDSFGWALSCCSYKKLEAEDVLQTTYLKVLQGRASYKGGASFKTWLFSIIRNTAIDLHRRRFIYQLRLKKYVKNLNGNISYELEDQDDESQVLFSFRRVLTALPNRQREVLQLVFYNELTIQEAAEVMGVSLGSARTHYFRGKKKVQQLMEKHEIFEE